MLGELAILDAQNLSHNPIHRSADPGEPAVKHDIIAVGHDQRIFIAQLLRRSSYQLEQTLAPRCDVTLCWI